MSSRSSIVLSRGRVPGHRGSNGWWGRAVDREPEAAVGYVGASPDRVGAGGGCTAAGLPRRPVGTIGSRRVVVACATLLLMLVGGVVLWRAFAVERPAVWHAARPDTAGVGSHRGLSSLPLAAQGVVSAAVGSESGAYAVHRLVGVGDGYLAVNPSQHLRARFAGPGVVVRSGRIRVGMSLRGVGYGSTQAAVGESLPRVRANGVVFAFGGLREWYANGPLGLEQGFTLARAPGGVATGPLTLSLAFSGNARVSADADGRGLTLSVPGGSSLRYDKLLATDAGGRVLHSWMTLQGTRLLLRVDARGARYPLSIDPLIQQGSKLTGGREESGEGQFGFSVAVSSDGNTAMIGAAGDNRFVGAAWVFTRSEGRWTQQGGKIPGLEETGAGQFGTLVALAANGNTAVIGGPTDNSNAGAAWVFTRSEGRWAQQGKKLTGGREESGEGEFGYGLAVSPEGTTAFVGAPADNRSAGAVWVFTSSEGRWTQQGEKLTAREETGEGRFGWKIALSTEASTAVIGGFGDSSNAGAVWVFTSSSGRWTQQAKLTGGSEETSEGALGYSVAVASNGNTVLAGAPGDNSYVGAVWAFTRSEGRWAQQGKKIVGSEEVGKGYVGYGVALSADGNLALVGGAYDNEETGSAWVFMRSEGRWTQQGEKLTGKEEVGSGRFGFRVALSAEGTTALIGGFLDNTGVGAAWAFTAGLSSEESYGCENEAEPNLHWFCVPSTVNAATGNLSESQSDLAIGGRGPGLRLVRTYNSQLAAGQSTPGPFGYGWTASYGAHLVINETAGTATVYQENGSAVTFNITPGRAYAAIGPRVLATLVKEGTSYVYTLPNQMKLEFNSEGKLVKETERKGNSNTLTYREGKLEKVTDGASRSLTFKYNAEGLVESVEDPMKHILRYTYAEKQLASVTIERKERWKFEYEAPHLLKKITDGRGNSAIIKYEASTHRVEEEEVARHTRKFRYGSGEATITEPNRSETVATFNEAGEPTKVTRARGVSGVETTTEYEYQSGMYTLSKMTNGNKNAWKYVYSSEGNKTSETDPTGDKSEWEYDTKHNVIKETTPEGEATTIKRNTAGEPSVIERPINSETQKTEYKYSTRGDLEEEINPLGRATKFTYDAYGDKATETDPETNERKWKYNEDSQKTEETSPRRFSTTTEVNERGLPTKVTDPLRHTTEYKYDGNQNIESETDGNAHTTKYEYNEENLRTKIVEPNRDTVETGYDAEGQMTSRTDGNTHVWEYKRNALEQVTEEKNPLGKTWKRTYDRAGNLKTLEDPERHTTEYMYDNANRREKIKYSTGKPSEVTFEYNKDSKVTKMKDETGTTENTYDKLDRLAKYKSGAGNVVEYVYNLANLPTKITYPNERAVEREYDRDNRLEKVTDWKRNTTSFKYNADSELEKATFPSASENKDEYAYNEADQVSEVKMLKGATSLGSLVYERDGDGQVTKTTTRVLPGPEVNLAKYDENNRLIEANGKTNEYDKANNPTRVEGVGTYTYNEANQLREGPESIKYTYNEDGQRTETKPSRGPATTYGYDQAGNLTATKRPEEGSFAKIEDTYTYDGTNLRQAQTINGVGTQFTWNTSEATPFLVSEEAAEIPNVRPVGVSDTLAFGTTRYFIYGPENIPVEQITTVSVGESSSESVLYLHHDQQGSTRLLTNSEGNKETAYTYNSYGSLERSTGTATTPLRDDGQYTNNDTGLIYLRARTYDPSVEQFLTIDPALEDTGEPYTYTKDNPLNLQDSTGKGWRDTVYWCAFGVGVVAAAVAIGAIAVAASPVVVGVAVATLAVAGAAAVATYDEHATVKDAGHATFLTGIGILVSGWGLSASGTPVTAAAGAGLVTSGGITTALGAGLAAIGWAFNL